MATGDDELASRELLGFSRRSLTMFVAGFYRQSGAASVQCWYRSDASSFQIGVSGRGRTSLTAERVDQGVGRILPTPHLDVRHRQALPSD
jgi:hypothetical protein